MDRYSRMGKDIIKYKENFKALPLEIRTYALPSTKGPIEDNPN